MQLALRRHVHNNVTQIEELLGRQGLSEQISYVLLTGDMWHLDAAILDKLSNPKVFAIDVLGARVVLRIIGKVLGTRVVHGQ